MENKSDPRWPLYYSDTIHVANLDSGIGILTLWTKKERVIEKISEKDYSFIGQLYSKEYGLQILVRNLLANPYLRDLVVVGIDLNGSSEGLVRLFEEGINEENIIIGTEIKLDEKIKKEHIDELRRRVKLHDLRTILDFKEVDKYLQSLPKKEKNGELIIIPLPDVNPPRRFPTDFSGFKVRGKDFYNAYNALISYMLRFGTYDPEIKKLETLNITFFVSKLSKKDQEYLKSRKSKDVKIQGTHVTNNGKKFSTYFFDELDTWDELKDFFKLVLTEENVCVMVARAYIQETDLEDAVEMMDNLEETLKWDQDPNGNIVLRVEEGKIKVMHLGTKGEVLDEFSGNTAKEIYRKIASENRISLFYHALDIGAELQKAEIALKEGRKYVQDRNI